MSGISAQVLDLAPKDAEVIPGVHVPGFTGQGWSTHETMLVVRWLFAHPDAWDQAMKVARDPGSNPHTVADTLHEQIVPQAELDAIAAQGFDPAKVNWLEIAHELIERRDDPQPAQEHAGVTAQVLDLAAPAPYTGDSAAETAAGDFRRVVFTSPRSQLVVMTLNPGQQIGSEIHRDGDQLFMVLSGTGTATLNLEPHDIGPGSLIAVPAGTRHNVTAGEGAPLRLVTVYSPPQHPPGTVEHTKGEAADEASPPGTAVLRLAAQPAADGPDDPTAAMATARHLHDTGRHLAAASGHLDKAREAPPGDPDGHISETARHLDGAHTAAHDLAAHLRASYPDEARDLDALTETIGLAKSVSDQAKTATTAHLTQTICNHLGHTIEHVKAMGDDPEPKVREFNGEHARTHMDGAIEHVGKLTRHLRSNYPDEAKHLAELKGAGTVTAQMAEPESISGQLDLSAASRAKAHATASATARRTAEAHAREREARDAHGRFTVHGDVMHYQGSLGVDRKDMPQVSGLLADGRYAPSSEMMPKFLDRLKAKGVKVTHERAPAGSLKPTQTTGDMRAVRGIAGSLATGDLKDTKPVLVSSDGRVVDGHHQWAAHILGESEGTRTGSAQGEPVIRADLPAARLMDEARQFANDQGIQNRKTGVAANPKYAKPITEQAGPADSLEKYTRPDGTLDPERAALHQRIISGILAGHKPQDHPVATFFGGGPAAGKSTALKATHPDSAHIDPDEIKAQLPEYQQMRDAKDPRAAAYVHEESSQLAKQATKQAQGKRLNFTLDGTGDSDIAKMAGKVNDARKHGYMTEGKYVTVGTGEAVKRAQARAAATGRHVPETFIRETHAAVSDTYAKAAKMGLFDKTELWDTSGPKPALVAHKEPGGSFTVTDPAAWQQFLNKAQEGA